MRALAGLEGSAGECCDVVEGVEGVIKGLRERVELLQQQVVWCFVCRLLLLMLVILMLRRCKG